MSTSSRARVLTSNRSLITLRPSRPISVANWVDVRTESSAATSACGSLSGTRSPLTPSSIAVDDAPAERFYNWTR